MKATRHRWWLANICLSNGFVLGGNNGIRCMSSFLLWICDMAGLLLGTFVSWWYLPLIWSSVTGMPHYYHARHQTDDWQPAYIFSLVYLPVEVCLVGVFHHSVSTRQDPCVRVQAPLTLASPSRNRTGVTRLSTWAKRGTFELTHGSVCLHYSVVICVIVG